MSEEEQRFEEWKRVRREAVHAWKARTQEEYLCKFCGLVFRQVATLPTPKMRWRDLLVPSSYSRKRCPRCKSRDVGLMMHVGKDW